MSSSSVNSIPLHLCTASFATVPQQSLSSPTDRGKGSPTHTYIHTETHADFSNMDDHATRTHRSTISRQRWKGRGRLLLMLMRPEWTQTRLWQQPMPRCRPLGCQCKPRWKSWSSQGKIGSVHATANLTPMRSSVKCGSTFIHHNLIRYTVLGSAA